MKRLKKELSWLLVVALVVSSLVIGLGQLTPMGYDDAAGTGVFRVDVGVGGKSTSCNGTTDHGTDSNLIFYALNAGGGTISQCTLPGAGGPLNAHDSNTRVTSFTYNGAAMTGAHENAAVTALGTMAVSKLVTQVKLVLSGGDNLRTDWINIYYSHDGGSNYTLIGSLGAATYDDGGTQAVATPWIANNAKTLAFNANGGSPSYNYDAIPGQTIAASLGGTPTRIGHTFTGWASVPARMPNAAATYYAGWSANSYSITFNGNGATGGVPATITQNYGTAVTQPANPYRTGYTFTGWSPACPTTMGTGTACVAQWSLNSYTITWDANGGTGGTTTSVPHGTVPTAPADPTRTNYTFNGWSPTIVAATGATTYTAQWTINSYTITWDANGGTGGTTTSVPHGTVPTAPADPTRTNYTFNGWSPTIVAATGATTYTAQWTINSYTITWNAGGGTGGTTTSVNHGVTPTPPSGIARTGYTLIGWSPTIVAATGNTTYTAQWTINSYTITWDADGGSGGGTNSCNHGATPTAIGAGTKTGYTFTSWSPAIVAATGNTTYTAQWTINNYTVSFSTDGGSTVTPKTQNYGTSVTEPTAPTKTGNTFDGWYSDAGLTTAVTWPYTLGAADVTFYAKWTVNSYYITFDANGGTGGTGPTLMQYGATLTAPTVTKTGSTFSGWSTTVPATVPAADTTYTAQWDIDSYTISFDSAGGSAVTPITQEFGTSVTAPADPTKTGYTFTGWDPAVPNPMPAQDVECVAQWTINTYYVIFDANGGTGTMSNQGITYNTSANLTANTFTNTGYTFAGWNTLADGSGTDYADEASFGPIGTANVTLYAQWTEDQIDIALVPADDSTTVIDDTNNFIYGLEQGMSQEDFEALFVAVLGDGRLEITPYHEFGLFGTGTKVELIDNNTEDVLETYYIVIFGDVNGDGYVTAFDGSLLYNVDSLDIEWDLELEPYLLAGGDLDGDGYITAFDGSLAYNIDSLDMNIDQITGQCYE